MDNSPQPESQSWGSSICSDRSWIRWKSHAPNWRTAGRRF